jgi:tripartite-type tricarboxylate transporter receptor subunit TctC
MRSWLTIAAALGLTVGLGLDSVSAQDYPTSTITIVMPFSAGGPTDTVAAWSRNRCHAPLASRSSRT